jgi:GNAT superfamily N-acetyltransferase
LIRKETIEKSGQNNFIIDMTDGTNIAINENPELVIRPLEEEDLPVADRVMRLAFGTFLGLPEPLTFLGDGDYVHTRWKANPGAAWCATLNGLLVGSAFASNWGSVGFFGPLTVHPDFWDKGVAKKLLVPVVDYFDKCNTKVAGLFTFANSSKHVGLYQQFGFWPQYLTAIMSKTVDSKAADIRWSLFSGCSLKEKQNVLTACRKITDSLFEGLDVSSEIRSVSMQNLGDTLLLYDDHGLSSFAVCHYGPGTEAGPGACYIKFGVARPGPRVTENFSTLIKACEQMSAKKGLQRIVAGMNTSRRNAYVEMLRLGFRTGMQGVVMQRPDVQGYHIARNFIIDDWR